MSHSTVQRAGGVEAPGDVKVFARPIAVTKEVAAESIGVAVSSISRLIREGKLPARYFGSKVLVDYASLERFYLSLPSEKQVDRECAANRYLADAAA